jgi:hypothetical protein
MFVNCLQAASRNANTQKLLQLWHPNALTPQIGRKNAGHIFGDVPAYATLLFGQAAPVNYAAAAGCGPCHTTNSGHNSMKKVA